MPGALLTRPFCTIGAAAKILKTPTTRLAPRSFDDRGAYEFHAVPFAA